MSTDDSVISRARELRRLHSDPELLVVVNVWDAITATTVANTPGTKALATASHSIAATFGYPDQEAIPRDLMTSARLDAAWPQAGGAATKGRHA